MGLPTLDFVQENYNKSAKGQEKKSLHGNCTEAVKHIMQPHTCGEWTSQSNQKCSYAALYRGLNDLKQANNLSEMHRLFWSYIYSDGHSGAEEQWRHLGQDSNRIWPRGVIGACSAPAHAALALPRQQATVRSGRRSDTAAGSPGSETLSAAGLAAKPQERTSPPPWNRATGWVRHPLHPSHLAEALHEGRQALPRAESPSRDTNANLSRVVLFVFSKPADQNCFLSSTLPCFYVN